MSSVADYSALLRQLLPQGDAFLIEPDSVLYFTLEGLAVELARIDQRGTDLFASAVPSESEGFAELLGDWEQIAGLPDECFPVSGSTDLDRKRALISLLRRPSGQSVAYFVELIRGLTGVSASISLYEQFQAGHSRAGDPLSNGEWVHVWEVSLPSSLISGQHECLINRLKPAHTFILFNYV